MFGDVRGRAQISLGDRQKRERENFLQISQSCRKAPSCQKCIKLAFLSLSRDRGRSFLFSRLKVGLSRNISFPRDSSSIISTAVRTKRGGRTWRNTLCVFVPDTARHGWLCPLHYARANLVETNVTGGALGRGKREREQRDEASPIGEMETRFGMKTRQTQGRISLTLHG